MKLKTWEYVGKRTGPIGSVLIRFAFDKAGNLRGDVREPVRVDPCRWAPLYAVQGMAGRVIEALEAGKVICGEPWFSSTPGANRGVRLGVLSM